MSPELAPASTPEPLAPPLLLAASVACVAGAAALADCAVLAALFKRSKAGLFSIILQLALADIILLGTVIGPELWSINSRTWHFGNRGCVAYQGLNIFTSTLSTFLVTAVALHTLTTIQLEEKAFERRRIKRDAEDNEEIRSSQHSLVAKSDSSTPPRTMSVDYRVLNTRVPATLPTVFVWILAVSLSVPEFALAAIVHIGKNVTVCTLDSSHQFNMYSMLAVFNLFIPLFLMTSAIVFIIIKLNSKKMSSDSLDICESVAALKLSLWLMCAHVILCAPRSVLNVYRVYSTSMSDGNLSTLDLSLHDDTITIIRLALSSAYLIAALLRPLLCMTTLPHLRSFFSFGVNVSSNV